MKIRSPLIRIFPGLTVMALVLTVFISCWSGKKNRSDPEILPGTDISLQELILPVPGTARLADSDYVIWGASMIRTEDGTCHLFFTRWPRAAGFQSWVVKSEIAHAVSDKPLGPYRFRNVAIPARGKQYWDGMATFNPNIHRYGKRYYLYYTGTRGNGRLTSGLNWNHRNNQRIGVAVAEQPDGPWKRFDVPLIDVSKDPGATDALITTNPSVTRMPGGGYLMVYKAAAIDSSRKNLDGQVVHRVATSESPTGPFIKQPGVIFDVEKSRFPAEDPYIWYQKDRYLAVVKDMSGAFTDFGRCLVLFESSDGLNWQLCRKPLVSKLEIRWENDGTEKVHRLERPQLWFEDGIPAVLFAAVSDSTRETYNVHIPLETSPITKE